MNAPVQAPCYHGWQVHGRCMLERADRIACERRPAALHRVPSGMAVGTTTSPPSGTYPRNSRERGRSRREVGEDVRGPTVLDDSRSGTLAAGPDRAPKHRCIQHVRGHVVSPGTLRNSIVPPVYLVL